MKRRILSILAIVGLVLALTVPFATPVLADPAPGTSPVITPTNICSFALPVALTSMVFHGSGFTATTTVEFADAAHITVTRTPSGDDASHFTATINVAAGASHGMKEFRFKDGAFTGAWVYNEFSVGTFNWPPGSSAGAVGLSITACNNPSGAPGTEYGATVHQGDPIYYRLALSVNTASDFDFYGGELSVQFPDKLGYHKTAGYGALTTGFEQIPEVSVNNTFTVTCQTAYFADAADLDVTGHLLAEVDYGPHADNLLQVAGIQEGFSPTVASASVQITLLMVGKLEVKKLVDLNGALATGVTQNFTVEVDGTGGPYFHTFVVIDGVVQNPNPWVLLDLVPGSYNVVESSPAPNFAASGGGLIEVTSNGTVTSNITNTLVPGNLEITKIVNPNGQSGSGINETFTVTVTGPSYPFGLPHNFVVIAGNVQPLNPWVLSNLMPGAYTITESDPSASWTHVITSSANVTVVPGETAHRTVTNSLVVPHTQLQTMTASPPNVPAGGGLVTITVTDKNDGTVDITGASFTLSSVPPITVAPNVLPHAMSLVVDSASSDGIMQPNEIWTFTLQVFVSDDTLFTAVGTGFAGDIEVSGASETGTTAVTIPHVPASSNLSLGLLIVGFAGLITFFGWQRRKRSQ